MPEMCRHCRRPITSDAQYSPEHGRTLERVVCAECGWPLALAQVQAIPDVLEIDGSGFAHVAVVIQNVGHGVLYYHVNCPLELAPVTSADLNGLVGIGQAPRRVEFRLTTEAQALPSQIVLDTRTLTRGPDGGCVPRTVPLADCWDEQPVAVPVHQRHVGPVLPQALHLVFGSGVDETDLVLLNYGDVRLHCTFSCTGGFEARPTGGDHTTSGTLTLPAGVIKHHELSPSTAILRVKDMGGHQGNGVLRLQPGRGLPEIEVGLERLTATASPPVHRGYSVGIDFGTSKTVVAWMSNYAFPPTPTIFEWDRPAAGLDRRLLPSAVRYPPGGGHPQFGDQAFDGGHESDVGTRLDHKGCIDTTRGTLYVGMKRFLRGSSPEQTRPLHAVVTDYFRHIFTALERAGQVDLKDADIVLSLPVLADVENYEDQKAATLAAAREAGARFGITDDQFITESEPVCAAIDLVRSSAGSAGAHDGDWLCVFDCGAGTTDISLVQVGQRQNELRFDRAETIGIEWGGDDLDMRLYDEFLSLWCDPDRDQNVRDGHEVIRPEGPVDKTRQESYASWLDYMRQQQSLRFVDAAAPVSRSRLLGLMSQFKERYLTVTAETPADLTSEAPLSSLSANERTRANRWVKLNVEQTIQRVQIEIPEVRDRPAPAMPATGPMLRERLPAIFEKLHVARPRMTLSVGGTTLVRGWREGVDTLGVPLNIRETDPHVRRFHVACGAAQYRHVRVVDRLPDIVRVEFCRWRPGHDPEPADEYAQEVAPGKAPGHRTLLALRDVPLRVDLKEGGVFRLWLGQRLLRQVPVAAVDGAEQARLLFPDSPPPQRLYLRAEVEYQPDPLALHLLLRWQIGPPGDWPDAAKRGPVRVPHVEI